MLLLLVMLLQMLLYCGCFFYVRSFAVRALASGNAGECWWVMMCFQMLRVLLTFVVAVIHSWSFLPWKKIVSKALTPSFCVNALLLWVPNSSFMPCHDNPTMSRTRHPIFSVCKTAFSAPPLRIKGKVSRTTNRQQVAAAASFLVIDPTTTPPATSDLQAS